MADSRTILSGINLNLLTVLNALLRHRSASRAAEEIGVTPSAVSHSLRELRTLFSDELFVRERYGLTPTSLALSLQKDLGTALGMLSDLFERRDRFDPTTSTKRCVVASVDDLAKTAFPLFIGRVLRNAPQMTILLRARNNSPMKELDSGAVDLVTMISCETPGWAGSEQLYSDEVACVVRGDHPTVRGSLSVDEYQRLPHIQISPEGYGRSAVDLLLDGLDITRRVSTYCYSFSMAAELVAQSDAILTAPLRFAQTAAVQLNLQLLAPPIPLPGFTLDVIWHRARDDSALRWIREQLIVAAREIYRDDED